MTDRKETLYVFDQREPVWKSAVRDAISFGGFIATAVALNRLIPPSAWLNAALAVCWILWLAGKGIMRRMLKTPAEAMAWLVEQYPASVDTLLQGGDAKQGSVRSKGSAVGEAETPSASPDLHGGIA